MTKLFLPAIVIIGMLLCSACSWDQAPAAAVENKPVNTFTAKQAAWVYLHPPLPRDQVGQPLFSGRDDGKIAQLLEWIEHAKPVDDATLSMPRRSKHLEVHYNDGSSIGVSPAWRCTGGTDEQGNMSSTCTQVENKIIISPPGDVKPYYVDSPELYAFIGSKSTEWMPVVPIYRYPAAIRTGEPFTLEGNAWVSDKVILELKKGDEVRWSADVVPAYGHFTLPVTLSGNYEAGEYTLYFRDPQGRSWVLPVQIVK
jgi:hypothetical protein